MGEPGGAQATEQPRRGWMVLSTPVIPGVDVDHDHDPDRESNRLPPIPEGVHKGGGKLLSLPLSADGLI